MELVAEKYKETEVGLIPSDWEVKPIGEIFTFYSTSNFSKAEMLLNGEVGCVHYGLIHAIDNSHYSLSNGTKYYVTKEQAKYEKLQEGDVIMVDASEDLVGLNKSVEVFNLNNKEYIAGLHTFHLRDVDSNYVGTFRGLILNSNSVKKQMLRLAVGMKVFGVSKPQLQQVFVPVPPKPEQSVIATVLSNADALITSLEKLITKKRNIKQGAMQKLLQPKEGWEVKKLGEIGECIIGLTYTPSNVKENGTLVLRSSNVQGNTLKFDDNVFVDIQVSEKLICRENDILICVRNGSRNLIGKCALIKGRAIGETFGAFMSVFRSPFNEFVFILFQSNIIKKQIDEHLGATINQITNKSLNSFEIPFPPPEEQTEIANILTDMDNEINALETKLDKYRKVKLGMMQNLLTGKIRLN